MNYVKEPSFNVEEVKDVFQEAFSKIWSGQADNDSFNRLVLEAELNWREISVLRAYTKYFRQIGFTFSEQYIAETLVAYADVARLLVELFKFQFDPDVDRSDSRRLEVIENKIQEELDKVTLLDEDRILRRYLDLIYATVRTNYFQVDEAGEPKDYLAFKLDPYKISEVPLPLPKHEIYVFSSRFEGVHLRSAKVARGGIRWSDRREDYRTEVLGLMKAQQVKNAVIVPAGAKGGFVVKQLTAASREAMMREGIACYQNFIRGLLDLTDNLVKGELISPQHVVCYDDPDPYLVVAADKGTATFSDIANYIAVERGYWMGDAFASGGSTGYDHKKMGITARGAWVSAERHFQELGINPDITNIAVIGIGDMAGDVFGNGMLMSQHIKLVAAFNHMHIFLDPAPDPKVSYEERKRLFEMPRSTWEDYNRNLISNGGGVYSRAAKAVPLSPEIKALLKTDKKSLVPNELIRCLLQAPVDLIWNGGIGTYIKASQESHADVGDRSNDNVRVDGAMVRARVFCEGGNLGATQLGRVEYELCGGKVNTDFIDNSAGVDCSDHEVNIKILLNTVVDRGDLTSKQRNNFLAKMKNEVAELVLQNNYHQNLAISIASFVTLKEFGLYTRYINDLEHQGKFNRELEFFPDAKILSERRAGGRGLTRPELSILFAYTKNILKAEILKSELVEDPYMIHFVKHAFPMPLRRRFESQLYSHYLSKEIIATQLCNRMVAEMGITFVYQMMDETNASISAIIRAYAAATKIFHMAEFYADIESLDYQVDAKVQYQMTLSVIRLVRRATRWLLRNRREKLDVQATIDEFSGHVHSLLKRMPKLLLGADKDALEERKHYLIESNVPTEIALKVASASPIYHALNIIEAAQEHQEEVFRVAKIYFMLVDRLNLLWFRDQINAYPITDRWSVLAKAAYKGDLDWIQRALTVTVLLATKSRSIPGKVNEWFAKQEPSIKRWQAILSDLRDADSREFAILFVAIRELLEISTVSGE